MKTQRPIRFSPLFPLLAVLCLTGPLLGGCATASPQEPAPLPTARVVDPPSGSDMLNANTYAGDALANMLLKRMGGGGIILCATFVDLDTLDRTSSLGRTTSQQVASRIAQHGFRITDVRLSENMLVKPTGEFMLSRDICQMLARDYNAQAVLVGTFAYSGNKVFVSSRIIRLADAAVIAAYEYYLPVHGDAGPLLSGGGSGGGGGGGSRSDAAFNRYAARGQAFDNCGGAPAVTAAAASPRSGGSVSSSSGSGRSSATSTRGASRGRSRATAPRRSSGGYSAPARAAAPQGEGICPQDRGGNIRVIPSTDQPYLGGESY